MSFLCTIFMCLLLDIIGLFLFRTKVYFWIKITMSISKKIDRTHVLKAIIHIDKFGIPSKKEGKVYFLKIGVRKYPLNYIICIANFFAEGFQIEHNPDDFNSVQAKKILEELDFEVITEK